MLLALKRRLPQEGLRVGTMVAAPAPAASDDATRKADPTFPIFNGYPTFQVERFGRVYFSPYPDPEFRLNPSFVVNPNGYGYPTTKGPRVSGVPAFFRIVAPPTQDPQVPRFSGYPLLPSDVTRASPPVFSPYPLTPTSPSLRSNGLLLGLGGIRLQSKGTATQWVWDSPIGGQPVAVVAPQEGGTPQSLGIGLASEVDDALAAVATSGGVTVLLGQSLGTDLSQSFSSTAGAVGFALGQSSETDIGQPMTTTPGISSRTLGQSSETDLSQATTIIPGATTSTLGQATEADVSQSMTIVAGATSLTLGQSAEADSALGISVAAIASVSLGRCDETDLSQGITASFPAQTAATGQAAETDSGLTVTVSAVASLAFSQAIESDTGLIFTVVPGAAYQSQLQVSESDTGLSMTPQSGAASVSFGQALETDSSLTVTPQTGGVSLNLGQPLESDLSPGISPTAGAVSSVVGQAVETSSALALSVVAGASSQTFGQASSTETALAMAASPGATSLTLSQGLETDSALTVSVSVGTASPSFLQATATENALLVTPAGGAASGTLGQASETEVALSFSVGAPATSVLLGLPEEEESSSPSSTVEGAESQSFLLSEEGNTALSMSISETVRTVRGISEANLATLLFVDHLSFFPEAVGATRSNPATGIGTHNIPEQFLKALCAGFSEAVLMDNVRIQAQVRGTDDVSGQEVLPTAFTFPGVDAAVAAFLDEQGWTGPSSKAFADIAVGALLRRTAQAGYLYMQPGQVVGTGTGIVSPASNPGLATIVAENLRITLSEAFASSGYFSDGDVPGNPVNPVLAAQLPIYATWLAYGFSTMIASPSYKGDGSSSSRATEVGIGYLR